MLKTFAILSLLLLITPAFAQTYQYCVDNTTLRKISESVISVPELNITRTINTTEDIQCQYNCDMQNNVCYEPPWKNWGIGILIVVGIIFAIWMIRWLL